MNFKERKALRKAHNEANVYGWKMIKCGACNGSGYYDHNGSPPCGMCEGSGRVRISPKEFKELIEVFKT